MIDMDLVRLSVNLNQQTADALKQLAADGGISYTEAIRRAISLLKFVHGETSGGRKVQIMDSDGRNKRELVMMP